MSSGATPGDWLRLFRVRNYPNYLVVVVAALAVSDGGYPWRELAVEFLLFGVCLYSGIYIVNEVLDADLDRQHPVKRERPVPSGRIPAWQALALAGGLWALAFGVSAPVYRPFYLAFIAVNLVYALVVKRRGGRNLIAVTSALRASMGFVIAGKGALYAPGLLLLCTLFMASVQQVKFGIEGTIGHRNTGAKLLALAGAMVPISLWCAPSYPVVVAWTTFAMVAWVLVPWRFPQAAGWVIGADVPEPARRTGPPVDVVAFDFDGTLCDSIRAIQQAVNEMAPRMGFPPVDEERYREFRTLSVRQIQKELGLSAWQMVRLGRHARQSLYARTDTLKPIAGIPEVLQALRRSGYRLAIVSSNRRRNAEVFLRAHGMDCFDAIFAHRGLGSGLWRKREQLRALVKELGGEGSRFVYVCDEIRDVEAAREVGMPVIAVTWGANTGPSLAAAGPTLRIDAPEQLEAAAREALDGIAAPELRPERSVA